MGLKHRRVRGEAYMELLDEFLSAVKRCGHLPEHMQFICFYHSYVPIKYAQRMFVYKMAIGLSGFAVLNLL